jgi:hypothetical protein
MSRTKKYTQSQIYEFQPRENISSGEIRELVELIRIGVSGEILEKASVHLKKHFVEIAVKKVEIEDRPVAKPVAKAKAA